MFRFSITAGTASQRQQRPGGRGAWMVTYVIQSYGANANRVYVTGASSGAMITRRLFAGKLSGRIQSRRRDFMGVPHSCFGTTERVDVEHCQCANGQRIMTAQQ